MHRNHVYVFDVTAGDPVALDDLTRVRGVLDALVVDAGLHPVGADATHRFEPQGLSVAVLLAESHVAVHTWPEVGAAYVTLTTCRLPDDGFVARARETLAAAFAGDVVARSVA